MHYPRLVKELAIILLVKLVVLLTIKHFWFTAPTVPENGTQHVIERLLHTEE